MHAEVRAGESLVVVPGRLDIRQLSAFAGGIGARQDPVADTADLADWILPGADAARESAELAASAPGRIQSARSAVSAARKTSPAVSERTSSDRKPPPVQRQR